MNIPPLAEFLKTKPIYYKKFDPNRIKKAYKLIVNNIKHPKRVHIIGTNGKGSTGKALAFLSYKSGFSVGHFTSPHILHYRERFWINGEFASSKSLENAHKKLFLLLKEDMANALSYFEYQTLLAFVLFENCDLQVIEAGLGGEYDATSVASYMATIFTPFGIDHQAFLGENIKQIAITKLKAMQGISFLAPQKYEEVINLAKTMALEKDITLYIPTKKELDLFIKKIPSKNWPLFLKENIALALFAMDKLQLSFCIEDLKNLKLYGRFYHLKPNIILDVGHNTLSALAVKEALDKKVTLIFNILNDKDAKEVLTILKEKIKKVEILPINTQRASSLKYIENILKELQIPYEYFKKIKKDEDYLVFGSFYVVEEFLKMIGVESINAS